LIYFKNNPAFYPPEIQSIFDSFLKDTELNIFETKEDIENMIQEPGSVESYMKGERGGNELLNHKALCYFNLEKTHEAFFNAFEGFLKSNDVYTEKMADYLSEIKRFSLMRKTKLKKTDLVIRDQFKYNFHQISNQNYEVDPEKLELNKKYNLKMWHDTNQVSLISNSFEIYGDSLAGIGRLVQRNDLRLMYRKFVLES